MTGLAVATRPLQAAVDDVVGVVREHARQTDEDAVFPTDALTALRGTRLLGLLVPEEHGGFGADLAAMTEVSQRLAREDVSVALIFAMHCQQVATILRYGTPELNADLLPRIAAGAVYVASVTSERVKGGHLMTSDSPLRARGDLLDIERDAPIVTGATQADGFLITMRAPDATAPTQVSLVYADRSQLDVRVTGSWQPMGMRASHSLPLTLSGTVPGHQVVGPHGAFREMAMAVFAPLAHLGWSACWLGAAAGALSRTVVQFRGSAGGRRQDLTSDLLLSRLGRVRGRLEVVHATLQRCLDLVQRPGVDLSTAPAQSLLNTLKTESSEQCFTAVNELIELVGLRGGYFRDSPLWLERVFRDLRGAALNYANDRLHLANGQLALLDSQVCLA